MSDSERLQFVRRVLGLFDGFGELHGDLGWRVDADYAPVSFFVNCNDLFWWATADGEDLTPESVGDLEQALADCKAADPDNAGRATDLYCCRRRKMRPQGACYKHIPQTLWPLFDACGPLRETDREAFGNPKKHPSEQQPANA